MSVVGIDFGAQSTKVGVARNKGIDIITNEVSNRSTPTLVGFNARSRALGEAAKTQETSNLKNTVGNLKRLIGRSFNDPDVQLEQEYSTAALCDVNGQAGVEVSYLGKKEKFTATQLVAMYLTKIRDITSKELKLPVSDVTISVPAWFTDVQRRAMIDAGEIAGLKVLRLINDTTATALGYGITKLDLPGPEEKPRRVMFVDIGHSDYTASIVEFRKGELNVKATACDRHFGGRNFDRALTEHFADEFKEKFKIDVRTHPKAWARTLASAEKMKKVLSANPAAPMSIESLMEDVDVRAIVKREELETMVKPLLDRVTVPIEQVLAEAKMKPEDIDHIEMVGGCTRVPAIKDAISKFFGKNLSFTLNQDEAIARGCAFSCAILSPVFRVRDFAVHDIVSYPIEFTWEQSPDIPDEDTSLTVFGKGNVLPSTKILTFYRKQPFDLEARYAEPENLPGKINPWVGRFSVKGVKADANDDFMICKLKARLNLHGILNLESGYYVEDMEVEEPVPEEGDKKDGDAMDTDATNGEQPKKTRKVKKQVRKGDLPISAGTSSIDQSVKEAFIERENAMYMEDKLIAETDEKKNELESTIYELRDKIDGVYSEFASEEEKDKLRSKLTDMEDWLYEEGEDTTKSIYVAKLDEIRFIAGPIIQRHREKLEAERQAILKAQEEEAAKKRAEAEAAKKAAEEAAKESQGEKADAEMKDAPAEGEATPEKTEAEEKQ
ncbi:heat shock protein Hsp88 [Aspergillus terreus NIH2624]|uniref:Heat shock protein Hsp88 n=1 Tax=Aspergillus terreus (strain NIH 2624 / FGSC A1156) TaxID=341663 RepID=Q0D0T1_ASPTN|nr:heat shock protein Hsp88 [Aspergillus terreus NIH2624]EAU39099.1 heat shock protein Hsp88 [Aspergillus terreus NIH2624]KAG2415286.1 heat shock protein Hsp88 [Aspergillus terreus]